MKPKKVNDKYYHSNQDKTRGVAAYAATGSFGKASEITGIPENTLRYWAKQDWFPEEIRRLDQVDTNEIKSTFTRIAKRATLELEDRLENGDEVVTKEGDVVRRKIAGRDLAIIGAVSVDKRKVLMEQPASIAIQNTNEKLLSLMQQFIKFSNAKEINAKDSRETGETIEGEGVQQIEFVRDSDQPVAEVGEPQEGLDRSNPEGSEAGKHDPGSPSEGQSIQVQQG